MEDRLHAAGKGPQLIKATETFEASNKTRADEHALYDELVNLGAEPEEADAYVELMLENC